jgi:cytochrome c oxidase subunit 4
MSDAPKPAYTTATTVLVAAAILLLLAGTSFWLSFLRLGAAALPVALGIAALKAAIVVVLFMELAKERASLQLAALSAIVMLLLLVGLTVADVLTREVPPLLPPLSSAVDDVPAVTP